MSSGEVAVPWMDVCRVEGLLRICVDVGFLACGGSHLLAEVRINRHLVRVELQEAVHLTSQKLVSPRFNGQVLRTHWRMGDERGRALPVGTADVAGFEQKVLGSASQSRDAHGPELRSIENQMGVNRYELLDKLGR